MANKLIIGSTPAVFNSHNGFTLAELLIALSLLAVLATFSIPKIVTSSQNAQNSAKAKEIAAMLTSAYVAYSQNNTVTSNTQIEAFYPYMQYVAQETGTVVDTWPGALSRGWSGPTITCGSAGLACLKMHSGAVVWHGVNVSFGGSTNNYAIGFNVDPDGTANGVQSLVFVLHINGRINTLGESQAGIAVNGGVFPPVTVSDNPSWFTWN